MDNSKQKEQENKQKCDCACPCHKYPDLMVKTDFSKCLSCTCEKKAA